MLAGAECCPKRHRKWVHTRLNGSIGCYKKAGQLLFGRDTSFSKQTVVGLLELENQKMASL